MGRLTNSYRFAVDDPGPGNPSTLNNGIQFSYNFNEVSGGVSPVVRADDGPNGYNLTDVNNTPSVASPEVNAADTVEADDHMLEFQGDTSALGGHAEFTIGIAARPQLLGATSYPLYIWAGSAATAIAYIQERSDGEWRLIVPTGGTTANKRIAFDPTVTPGEWLVAIFGYKTGSGISGAWAMDGDANITTLTPQASTDWNHNLGSTPNIYFASSNSYTGHIDACHYWDRYLTPAEMQEYFDQWTAGNKHPWDVLP